jgi:LPS export ABC transporter protein LptC
VKRRAAALLLLLCACNPQAPKPGPGAAAKAHGTPTPPALRITGEGTSHQPVRIIQQVHNRVEYQLIASSYESVGPQGSTHAVFQNANVTFHDRAGATTTARAPQAIIDEKANTVTLVGGVLAHSSSGTVLQCDRLRYDHATQMLHGDGHVTIVGQNGFRATGSSFDSNIALTHMTMR